MKTVVALDLNTVYGGLSCKASKCEKARCVSSVEPSNKIGPGMEVEGSISEAPSDDVLLAK